MGQKFRRLMVEDRELIGRLMCQGLNQSQIASLLGVHKSTISREVQRNKEGRLGYIVLLAQYKTEQRRSHYQPKIEKSPFLLNHVEEKLKLGWSPEQIAGRLKQGSHSAYICHESIYAYIFSPQGLEKKLYTYLRSRQKRRFPKIARRKTKRTLIPNRVSIHDRPSVVNSRETFGHWEADLIVFSQDKRANIFTIRERKSRYLVALKNENRSPSTINKTLLEHKQVNSLLRVKSITFDNDIAFTKHEQLADVFSAKTYFCDAYKSYQKGGIENANRQLRQYCSRKIDINALTQEELDRYVELINNRPMKCLGFKTPFETHLKLAVEEIESLEMDWVG